MESVPPAERVDQNAWFRLDPPAHAGGTDFITQSNKQTKVRATNEHP